MTRETIFALASAPGRSGVAVIRVSGPEAGAAVRRLTGREPPAPRRAVLRRLVNGSGAVLDEGLVLWFPGPASFTGEDVAELHLHGGPAVIAATVDALGDCPGLRPAEPGEFTRRAFENGKLDLTAAEGLADLVGAETEAQRRQALRQMQGELGRLYDGWRERLIAALAEAEAAIDFPDEDLPAELQERVAERISGVCEEIEQHLADNRRGERLREGVSIALIGAPNAGKSSLLNKLAGYSAAIVTDIPGTTRDVLRERIHLDGLPLHVLDTAGLREQADVVEAEGIRRARAAMNEADRILYIVDASTRPTQAILQEELAALPQNVPVTLVFNKIDLTHEQPRYEQSEPPRVHLSVATGEGIDLLRAHLKECVGYQGVHAGTLSARRRHLDALTRANEHLAEAERQLTERRAGELMAEELRQAQQCLGEITGEFTSDDLLGRIFSTFCIGK